MPPHEANEPAAQSRSPKDLLVDANESLSQLAQLLGSNDATKEEAQAMAQILSQFQNVAEALVSGQGPQAPQGQQSGPAPMEAGANPNARPA